MTSSPLEYQELELPGPAPRTSRASGTGARTLTVVGAIVIAGALLYWWKGRGFLAGVMAGPGGLRAADGTELLTHEVQPTDLRVTVLVSGTLESASSVNVLSEVEGQVAIISLVPEGTRVEEGDVVVELESSALRTRRTEQQIVVQKARAEHSQALQANRVAESQAESDEKTAELTLEFAKLDLEKYLEGDYPLELRALETATALAEEELERARVQLQFSHDLQADGFLSEGELEADRFRATQSEFKVEIAKERERLLQEYTFPRTKRNLESKVAEAQRALDRVNSLATAAVEQAKTNLGAKEATLRLEEAKLAHVEDQIAKCSMRAPQAGVVVYPVPEDDDLVELFIKQGTVIRERQHVFSIPDTYLLQVSTAVHEAVVNQVRPGMQTRVWIDVYPDLELRGEVEHVSPLPEPEDWRKATVKFYETTVKLLDQQEGLRPGMSAKLEILIDRQQNVLALPVQAVVQRGQIGWCYVASNGRPELRRLVLGKASVEHIAVLEGLRAGERVVLSPDILGIPHDVLYGKEEASFEWDQDALAAAEQAPAPSAEPEETEYEGVLLGSGGAMAEAEYETKTIDAVDLDEFEIKVVGGAPGATLDVVVDGVNIGTVTLDETGAGESQWSVKDGNFPSNFPSTIGHGSTVTVGGDIQGTLSR